MIQANRIGRRHLFSATCSAVFLFTLSAVSSGVEPLPVGPAISPDAVVACPIGLMGLFGQPTQEQCTQLDLSSCSQEVRNTCRSLTLAANIAAQRNGFVNGGEPITCPIASGTEPNLATCQNPFTFVPPLCSNDIIATCRSLLETEFLRAEAEKSVTDAIAPDVWSRSESTRLNSSHSRASRMPSSA